MMRLIAESRGGMTINELTAATSIPKTTLYDIVVTLHDLGMLACGRDKPRRYTMGLTSFLLGNRYAAAIDMIEIAKPHMDRLSGEMNRTVFLGIMDGIHVMYIEKSQPTGAVYSTAELYSRSDMYCTSLGKAMLAFMEDGGDMLDRFTYARHTPYTVTDRKKLLDELARTRRRGYAVDDRETVEQIACVGAPVFDRAGKVCAALSVTGLYDPSRDMGAEGVCVKKAAMDISTQLGYTGRRL